MLAKVIANRHKNKRVSWRLHGLIYFCQSQGVAHTHRSVWLKWLKSTSLIRCTCSTWRAWNLVQIKASSYWPTPVVPKGGEMGEGARQWKETSTLLLENLFKTPRDFCHIENKISLLPCSPHTYRICIQHRMNSAASHPSSRQLCCEPQRRVSDNSHPALASWPPSI